MKNFKGTIIEESLADKAVLKEIKILSTRVEKVVEKHKTPWLKQWTLHKVEIPGSRAKEIAEKISKSLDTTYSSWYGDYKNATHHYIIYSDKIFYINRVDKEQYKKAKQYGISLGIPEYQVDFSPNIK